MVVTFVHAHALSAHKILIDALQEQYTECVAHSTIFSDRKLFQTGKKYKSIKLETYSCRMQGFTFRKEKVVAFYSILFINVLCTHSHSVIDTHSVVMNCNSAKANFQHAHNV